ncbi:L,D-transpeptidase family protein [Nautilia sp.]
MRFLIFFAAVFLYSYSLIDTYRYEGEKTLADKIEKLLCSDSYWLERLKDKNVKWGYYESEKNILVCIKKEKILEVYKENTGKIELLDRINVLTGLDGDKRKEGDLKTPIGVYRLKALINNVNTFYGPFAFVTGYPNMFDKINNKNGHGIWIHGVPIKRERDDNNTRGCIVMDNDMLEKLKNEINYQKTFLLISEEKPLTTTKKEIADILAFIYRWRKAWRQSDFETYKSFYDEKFRKIDGKNLEEFLRYKKRVFENKKHQHVKIFFNDISIIPYQNIDHRKIFRVDMFERYISDNYKYSGNKEIFVKFTADGLKIIAEK